MKQTITLNPNTSGKVHFHITPTAKNGYTVQVGEFTKYFTAYVPPEPATLYGNVKDTNTNQNIQGALIQISGTGGSYQVTTNWQGNYQITNIVPGTYDGQVSHPDYETAYF